MLVAVTGTQQVAAANFFDTSEPDNLFNIGVRIGLNTANQTHPSEGMKLNLDSWGTGFDAGIVADLNFKNYLTIQPGFFFESRSNNYSYIYSNLSDNILYGHTRYTNFTVPVIASIRFNPADNIRWSIDFGPYFQFGLGGSDEGEFNSTPFDIGYFDNRNKFDAGLKMGTGFKFFNHYYIGIHYMAGFCDVWKTLDGGKHKSWLISIGYDF